MISDNELKAEGYKKDGKESVNAKENVGYTWTMGP